MDRKTVKVRSFGKMDRGMTAIGPTETSMDKASFTDVMTEYILDNGKTISYMDMENSRGLMERNIRASTSKT